ncbi:MAG: ribonuclease protein component [Actinomycetia bacterium]|nr:ribonuclease protein component [Actinomycetes bacterium]
MREAYVPAKHSQTGEEARFSVSDADTRRPGGRQGPSAQGPLPADRLIWHVDRRATFAELSRARALRRGAISVRVVRLASEEEPPRVAFAIGKRSGNAVARNRIRRRLRAALHEEAEGLRNGRAYLFGAAPATRDLSMSKLRASVRALLTMVEP